MHRLARLLAQFKKPILIIFVVLLAASGIYGSGLLPRLQNGGWEDKASQSSRFSELYQTNFTKLHADEIVLIRSNHETAGSPTFRQAVSGVTRQLHQDQGVDNVTSYLDGSPNLISKDHKSAAILIGLSGSINQQIDAATRLQGKLSAPGFQLLDGGSAFANYEISHQVKKDITKAESIAIPLLIVLLLLVFRGVVAASLPLLIGVSSVLGAFALTRLLTNFTDISIFSANVINFLSLGLAIDYGLLIVSRFREELAAGNNAQQAMHNTLASAGRTVLMSATIVTLGLASLLTFPQLFLRSMGIGGILSVVTAAGLALLVLPVALLLLGERINKWSLPIRALQREQGWVWRRIGMFVMRHPLPVLLVSTAFILMLAAPVRNIQFGYPAPEGMPASFSSRQVSDIMKKDFSGISPDPMYVLVQRPNSSWTTSDIAALSNFTSELKSLPGVTGVQSPTSAGPARLSAALASNSSLPPAERTSLLSQISGKYALIQLNYPSNPTSAEAQNLVRTIRNQSKPNNFQVLVGGVSPQLVDLLASLKSHLPRAVAIIVAATFIVMALSLGSIVLPIKAVVLNAFSLSAAFGILVWVFQYGHLSKFLNLPAIGPVDALQLVLIFTIAFCLAMDYEIFLVSRIKEYYSQTHDNKYSVAMGLEKTGPIITSAALLLVVVIGAFAAGQVPLVKQIGVGVSMGILLDATIIRALIVPATMQTLGKYNWWTPSLRLRASNVLRKPHPKVQ